MNTTRAEHFRKQALFSMRVKGIHIRVEYVYCDPAGGTGADDYLSRAAL